LAGCCLSQKRLTKQPLMMTSDGYRCARRHPTGRRFLTGRD